MSKKGGYSTTALLCFCALAFLAGRFIQQVPFLPEASSGFVTRTALKGSGLVGRRRAAEALQVQLDTPLAGGARAKPPPDAAGNGTVAAPPLFPTFESALAATSILQRRPPIPPGGSGSPFYTAQPFQLLSWYPRMYVLPGFLSDERCDHIVRVAGARLEPSSLALRKTDTPGNNRDVRTSQGTFMGRDDDPQGVLGWVEDKIAAIAGLPVNHGEPFNVLRYELGQHYDSHYDIFEPESYGPQPSQRVMTILFYLSDVEEGGETVFPLEGADGMARLPSIDFKSCNQGYLYKPRKGDALMFYSLHANGTIDKHALHGGCAVKKGTKWTATKWIRDKCFTDCNRAPS